MDWRIAVADVQPTAVLLKTFKDNLQNHSARLLLCHCLLMMDFLIGVANEQTKQFIYRGDSSCVNEDLCGRCRHATDTAGKGRQSGWLLLSSLLDFSRTAAALFAASKASRPGGKSA